MYGLAISASLMAFLFLILLYTLFHMGLRENMAPLDDGAPANKKADCSFETRVHAMALAWNDTANSPKYVNTDSNVQYKLWSSNVLRRGLDPVYTDAALFTHMVELSVRQQLDMAAIGKLMAPYREKELQIAAEQQPKVMSLQPVCMN